MGCGCGSKGGRWKVIYPDGRVALKNSEASAKLAAAKIKGSRIEPAR